MTLNFDRGARYQAGLLIWSTTVLPAAKEARALPLVVSRGWNGATLPFEAPLGNPL